MATEDSPQPGGKDEGNTDAPTALPEMLPRIYEELRSLAANVFRDERRDHATQEKLDWTNRAQFFAMAARMMRRVSRFPARVARL